MVKRVHVVEPAVVPIENWEAADSLIREIGDLQREIAAGEKKATENINKINEGLKEWVKLPLKRITLLTQSLEAFAAMHRDDFGGAKSHKLHFGSIGWRLSVSISIAKYTLELLKKRLSKEPAFAGCIRIKESVDKEALAKCTDAQLVTVSAQRDEKDIFFVEPVDFKTVDYGDSE
jgi:phage host-nuclease inhibitor protein Gam